MGYSPGGVLFSRPPLLHWIVRIFRAHPRENRELLLQSQNAHECAFTLGALAHYASDIAGHPAVNLSVPIQHPKLRAKYDNSVRYAQDRYA
jgi:hypothetical protein